MARCTSDANDRWLGKFLVQGQPGPAAIENKKKEKRTQVTATESCAST